LCGEAINIKKDKDLAIVSGHIFIKNVAEFSYLLANLLKINKYYEGLQEGG